MVKKCDISKRAEVSRELQLLLSGIDNGIDMILVTTYAGEAIKDKKLSVENRELIKQALSGVHRLGVIHGDLRLENIVMTQDQSTMKFTDHRLWTCRKD